MEKAIIGNVNHLSKSANLHHSCTSFSYREENNGRLPDLIETQSAEMSGRVSISTPKRIARDLASLGI